MTTNEILYPGAALVLGADGRHAVNEDITSDTTCCQDPLCGDPVASACAYMDTLPNGPMWDEQKARLRELVMECGKVPEPSDPCWKDMPCSSMVHYALYVSQVKQDAVETILTPVVIESSPLTASATLDDWLERYQWLDCYDCNCRSEYSSLFSPYRLEQGWACDGYCCCQPHLPDDFICALKHALVVSLSRMSRGVINNLDGINWVIAPLGAAIRPAEYPDYVQDFLDGNCEEDPNDPGAPCFCEDVQLEIYPTSETLPKCPTAEDFCSNAPRETVPAQHIYYCEEEADLLECEDAELCEDERTRIYPGVISAECIVRALLPQQCPNILIRDEVVVDKREYP